MSEMLSIRSAAAKGIQKVRKPIWANPDDHLKIDIIDGQPGPWLHLYSPVNAVLGEHNPQDILGVMAGSYDEECFVPFEPLSTTPALL